MYDLILSLRKTGNLQHLIINIEKVPRNLGFVSHVSLFSLK